MAHNWSFFRAGGFDQVLLRDGADLEHLGDLDAKLWVAIAGPAAQLELDEHTLSLLDGDKDGRIRVPDVVAETKWACSMLEDPDDLIEGKGTLPLSAIAKTEEGKQLRKSAAQILKNLGRESKEITTADTRDTAAIFAQTLFNGDGIVPPQAAREDEPLAQAIRDVMACMGTDKDMSGLDGVSKARVDQFFAEAKAFVAWWRAGEVDPAIVPVGDATAGAWAAFTAVQKKVDDFFARCALAAMDPSAAAALNPSAAELAALAKVDLSPSSEALHSMPIAQVAAGAALPFDGGLNPAFAAKVADLHARCVEPLLGKQGSLTEAQWREIGARLEGHRAWLGTEPAGSVQKLGIVRLKELVDGKAQAQIDALIVEDLALEAEAKAIAAVDKLVHYYRDLGTFLRNFVSFEDFYARRKMSAFQAGTLYLDGRSFALCLRVADAAKHAALAEKSMACLAYCDCVRKGSTEKMTIAVAVTNGDSDFLMVGRNGVFYDRKGHDWDATITRLIEQPISIRQAFWAPYKRVSRFISSQIERFASAREAESHAMLEESTAIPPGGAPAAPAPAEAPPEPRFDAARFAGIFAAIGLALGALGTAVAAIVTRFLELHWWQMPLAIAGALLAISGPSMLLAALKLRQRNLGPLLDAGGWAINTRARINLPFGAALTDLAALPPGSSRSLSDPYADKKRRWPYWIAIAAIAAGCVYLARVEIVQMLAPRVKNIPVLNDWFPEPPPAQETQPAHQGATTTARPAAGR